MSNQNQHADELFDALSKNKKKKKRRVLRTFLIVIVALVIVGITAVSMLRRSVEARFAAAAAEVLSYEVKIGSINTLVSGSGTLTEVDQESLTVPAGVEITEVIAERNATVAKGDVIATVDMATVMAALANVQAEIDELDEQIADAKGDEVSRYIKAGISGRVKILYAEKETDVTACMAQNGALAVLSLDGYMAVDIETGSLAKGDTVVVIRADGSQITGNVDTVSNGTATILMTDNGPMYEEEVSVTAEDGTVFGTGRLYIHNPLSVTGYAGTVSNVSVSENAQVHSSTTLFTLKDTSFSANYDALLRTRGEQEEILMELLTIYRDGAILAPMDGRISSIDYSEDDTSTVQTAYGTEAEETETALLTLCPNVSMCITIGIDETDILSLEVGQEAEVTVSSVSEEPIVGTVTEISKEATTTSGMTQYSAEVTIDKLEGMLPGMTADVDVKIQGVDNALIIPVEALHQTSNISYVYTSYNEETQQYGGMVEVITGMQNDNYVEILSGLATGDTVYYTKSQTFSFGFGMGGMSGMTVVEGGGMSDKGGDFGGRMPEMDSGFGGGNMPGMGGSRGG